MTFQNAEFAANRTNLESMLEFIEQQLHSLPISEQERHKLLIASEEIAVNIINFAYPESSGKIRIEIAVQPDQFSLTFLDEGHPFNPLAHDEGDLTLPAEMREPGGLGIVMIKQLMEKVVYEYKEGKNKLTLLKSFHTTHRDPKAGASKVTP